MEPRVSLITLGVADLATSLTFYHDGLGLPLASGTREQALEKGIAFFRLNRHLMLSLYPWEELAEDAQVDPESTGFRGVTLAHNVRSPEEADQVLSSAVNAGATLQKPAAETFWGGYSGYFRDPDGHLWEVAHNPFDSIVAETPPPREERPECIIHYKEIQADDDATYPGSDELLSIGSALGRHFGLKRLGIHHELLPPGRRTSWPHAEKTEEEFVFVLEGCPDVWLDGHLHGLVPGDAVGFVPGDGLAHTFINNTDAEVRLLVVGDTHRDDNLCFYAVHPERNAEIDEFLWKDRPHRELGPHDGLPDALREE